MVEPVEVMKRVAITLQRLDVDFAFLGAGYRWFREALENAPLKPFGSEIYSRIISAPYFMGMKFEAFNDRGNNDFYSSDDLEDVVTIVDGNENIVDEISKSNPILKT